ncbi:MAG: glycosyltransferase [Pseudomonadota bacterium]
MTQNAPDDFDAAPVLRRATGFDPKWFRARYGARAALPKGDDQALEAAFFDGLEQQGWSPNPLIDFRARPPAARDRTSLADAARTVLTGSARPHWLFDRDFYLTNNADVAAAVEAGSLAAYRHFLANGAAEGRRPHPLYCPPTAAALAEDGENPFEAFVSRGDLAGETASPLFDPNYYATVNPDAAVAVREGRFSSLFHHFCSVGIAEDRPFSPHFDRQFYTDENPDSKKAVKAGEAPSVDWHYLYVGRTKWRAPNPYFDMDYYCKENQWIGEDMARLGVSDPFEHYLAVGQAMGLKPARPLYTRSTSLKDGKAWFERAAKLDLQRALDGVERFDFPVSDAPALSIIVPVCGEAHFTYAFLKQAHAAAHYCKSAEDLEIEVIVVDNGSADETLRLDEVVSGVRIERFDKPLGFPKAVNAGANIARGDVLLIANNDVRFPPQSVAAGFKKLKGSPDIGFLGGLIVLPNGEVQEAGSLVFRDGSAAGFGRGMNPLHGVFRWERTVDYCSACFAFALKDAFDGLGGFDEAFSPGYYEETAFCMRLSELGLRAAFAPEVLVEHFEYGSYSSGKPPATSLALMGRNRATFAAQAGATLNGKPAAGPTSKRVAASGPSPYKGRILMIEDQAPDPALGAGFARSADIVRYAAELGWQTDVYALYAAPWRFAGRRPEPRIADGVDLVAGWHSKLTAPEYVEANIDAYDAVWICRTHNMQRFGARIRNAAAKARIPVVGDTEALAFLRSMDEPPASVTPDIVQRLRDEIGGATDADVWLAVNALEAEILQAAGCGPAEIVGHATEPRALWTPDDKNRLLFVGALHDAVSPNFESLDWFLKTAWPRIRKQRPAATFDIVGYAAAGVAEKLADHEGVSVRGAVDDLDAHFARADIFVAPTRIAAGAPHKVHTAMAAGAPVVMTPILFNQIRDAETDAAEFAVADRAAGHAFADLCLDLLGSKTKREAVSAAQTALHARTAAPAVFREALGRVLERLKA